MFEERITFQKIIKQLQAQCLICRPSFNHSSTS